MLCPVAWAKGVRDCPEDCPLYDDADIKFCWAIFNADGVPATEPWISGCELLTLRLVFKTRFCLSFAIITPSSDNAFRWNSDIRRIWKSIKTWQARCIFVTNLYLQPPPEKESLSFSKRQKLNRGGNAGTSFGSFRHLHISHNTPCLPPKILHNLCFYFTLGITKVLREIKGTAYAKHVRGGGVRGHTRRCANGEGEFPFSYLY